MYDFGYAREWTHGHLVPAAAFGALAALAAWRRWPRAILILTGAACLWALAGFAIVQLAMLPNSPIPLPTPRFLARTDGPVDVLDIGAGSGRATVMVLRERPRSRVTALDRFAQGYGIEGNSAERLKSNVRAAGAAADRLIVQTGDARQMPFPAAAFDGAVSSYVIDHLSREGERQALSETTRVLKPGGEFLLMVINRDGYVRFAYPFLHGHGYFGQMPARTRWLNLVAEAGLDAVEDGTIPGTLYVLAKKRG